ncbi:hypothetical protein LCGC14_2870750, partial [marine sediment metagenome]
MDFMEAVKAMKEGKKLHRGTHFFMELADDMDIV